MSSLDLESAARTFSARMPIGLILVAADGHIVYANGHACDIFDTTEEELAATAADCNVAQTLAERIQQQRGGSSNPASATAVEVVTRRGSPVHVEVAPVSLVGDGSQRGTLVSVRDVTQQGTPTSSPQLSTPQPWAGP